jgi:hypothetical protein
VISPSTTPARSLVGQQRLQPSPFLIGQIMAIEYQEYLPRTTTKIHKIRPDPVETDHGQLTARLRPTRGRTRLRPARVLSTGPAFRQNLRHGHDQPGLDADPQNRLPAAFAELALVL